MADFITQMLEFYIVEVVGPPLLVIAGISIVVGIKKYRASLNNPKNQ